MDYMITISSEDMKGEDYFNKLENILMKRISGVSPADSLFISDAPKYGRVYKVKITEKIDIEVVRNIGDIAKNEGLLFRVDKLEEVFSNR